MARPTKTLQEHLRDGSFRADRHAGLLGPLVDDADLAGLQATYRSVKVCARCRAELHEAVDVDEGES